MEAKAKSRYAPLISPKYRSTNTEKVSMFIECGLKAEWIKPKSGRHKASGASMTSILTVTSDMEFIDYRRIPYVGSQAPLRS